MSNRTPARERAKKRRRRDKARVWLITYLRGKSCVDCGESDPVVLEFDHTGNKKFNIGTAVKYGRSLPGIIEEAARCAIRCCNCHRRITFARALVTYRQTL